MAPSTSAMGAIAMPWRAGSSKRAYGDIQAGVLLDYDGCPPDCACLAEDSDAAGAPSDEESAMVGGAARNVHNFVIGKPTGVFFFTPEDPRNCYVVRGAKRRVYWFRNYLIVVTVAGSGGPAGSTKPR